MPAVLGNGPVGAARRRSLLQAARIVGAIVVAMAPLLLLEALRTAMCPEGGLCEYGVLFVLPALLFLAGLLAAALVRGMTGAAVVMTACVASVLIAIGDVRMDLLALAIGAEVLGYGAGRGIAALGARATRARSTAR